MDVEEGEIVEGEEEIVDNRPSSISKQPPQGSRRNSRNHNRLRGSVNKSHGRRRRSRSPPLKSNQRHNQRSNSRTRSVGRRRYPSSVRNRSFRERSRSPNRSRSRDCNGRVSRYRSSRPSSPLPVPDFTHYRPRRRSSSENHRNRNRRNVSPVSPHGYDRSRPRSRKGYRSPSLSRRDYRSPRCGQENSSQEIEDISKPPRQANRHPGQVRRNRSSTRSRNRSSTQCSINNPSTSFDHCQNENTIYSPVSNGDALVSEVGPSLPSMPFPQNYIPPESLTTHEEVTMLEAEDVEEFGERENLIKIVSPSKIFDLSSSSSDVQILSPRRLDVESPEPELIVIDSTSGSEDESSEASFRRKSPRCSRKGHGSKQQNQEQLRERAPLETGGTESVTREVNEVIDVPIVIIENDNHQNVPHSSTPDGKTGSENMEADIQEPNDSEDNNNSSHATHAEVESTIPETLEQTVAQLSDEDVEELELRKAALEGLIANIENTENELTNLNDSAEADDEILRARLLIDLVNRKKRGEVSGPSPTKNSLLSRDFLMEDFQALGIASSPSQSSVCTPTASPKTSKSINKSSGSRRVIIDPDHNITLTSFTSENDSTSIQAQRSSYNKTTAATASGIYKPSYSAYSKINKPSRSPNDASTSGPVRFDYSNNQFGIKKTIYNHRVDRPRKRARQPAIVIPLGLDSSDDEEEERSKAVEKDEFVKGKNSNIGHFNQNISASPQSVVNSDLSCGSMIDQRFEKSVSDYLKCMRSKVSEEQTSSVSDGSPVAGASRASSAASSLSNNTSEVAKSVQKDGGDQKKILNEKAPQKELKLRQTLLRERFTLLKKMKDCEARLKLAIAEQALLNKRKKLSILYNDLLNSMKEVTDKLTLQKQLEIEVGLRKRQLQISETRLKNAKEAYVTVNEEMLTKNKLSIEVQSECSKLMKDCIESGKAACGDDYKPPDRNGPEIRKKIDEIHKHLLHHKDLSKKLNNLLAPTTVPSGRNSPASPGEPSPIPAEGTSSKSIIESHPAFVCLSRCNDGPPEKVSNPCSSGTNSSTKDKDLAILDVESVYAVDSDSSKNFEPAWSEYKSPLTGTTVLEGYEIPSIYENKSDVNTNINLSVGFNYTRSYCSVENVEGDAVGKSTDIIFRNGVPVEVERVSKPGKKFPLP